MNRWTPALAGVLLALPLGLVACGGSSSSSSSSSEGSSGGTSTAACAPVRGSDLVVLNDDKASQAISAIVPIVRKEVAKPPLTTALNKVTAIAHPGQAGRPQQGGEHQQPAPGGRRQGLRDSQQPRHRPQRRLRQDRRGVRQLLRERRAGQHLRPDPERRPATRRRSRRSGPGRCTSPPWRAARPRSWPSTSPTSSASSPTRTRPRTSRRPGRSARPWQALNQLLAKRPLVALNPSPATDEVAFAVSSGSAKKYGLKTHLRRRREVRWRDHAGRTARVPHPSGLPGCAREPPTA